MASLGWTAGSEMLAEGDADKLPPGLGLLVTELAGLVEVVELAYEWPDVPPGSFATSLATASVSLIIFFGSGR